jgi:hypothetical protein
LGTALKKYDYILSIIFLLFAAGIFYGTKDYSYMSGDTYGAGVWPRFISVLMTILSLILLCRAIFAKYAAAEEPIKFSSGAMRRVFIIMGVIILFTVLNKIAGFFVASFLFVGGVMFVMDERRILWLLSTSVSVTLAVYFIFEFLLKMYLPRPFFM